MKKFNLIKLLCLTLALFGTVSHGFAQKKGEALNLGTTRAFKESLQKQVSSKSSVNARTGKPSLRVAVPGNKELSLDVNFQEDEKGGLTLVGRVNGVEKSTFFIQVEDGKLHGDIIMLEQKLAFEYGTREDGTVYIQEKDINKLVCVDYKVPPANTKSSKQKEESSTANARNLTLQSRPGAPYVIYLDFDGEHVPAGTGWNGGNAFYVSPMNVSSAVITEAWEIIAEDYRPFNVNVTTSLSVFNGYAATSRQRIIYTPDNNFGFYPNVGGGARYGTFRNNDWPCFVFMGGTGKWAGDIGSHEVGHTLDLEHDATYSNPSYYNGHNAWAPIMGSSYSPTERAIAQWSKGEYYNANMQQDDLAVIAYRIGYRGDDHGNSTGAATTLSVNSTTGAVTSRSGVIERNTDIDFFRFTTGSGSVSFNINTVSRHGNLDILARLYNSSGTVIGTYNITNSLNNTSSLHASISTSLSAGTYYLSVTGTGAGTVNTGYSGYGSLGSYTITGTVKPPLVAVRHIEAESYNGESGTGTEACTDAGGGQNLSQMHAG
ncbi:DVUA0089 family protein, partial [Rufibacter roseus]